MRVLVTGGAGFIGSHVAEGLVSAGHRVAVVDDLSHGRRENLPEGVEFYKEDIRGGCAGIIDEFRPEAVAHLAAQMDVRRSVAEPDFDAEVNVVGMVRLLQNCALGGVQKFVFSSTGGAIYGEQDEFPATEAHREYPISPYGVSKLSGERYLHYFKAQHGLDYVALRYANVYGPRQDPHGEAGVVAIFCGRLASGETSTINGKGEQTRDYVYGPDVAKANLLALENNVESGAYNIGTGLETSVNRLYRLLREGSGKDLPPEHGPGKPGEQLRSCIDPTLAAEKLGWRPETDLRTGLRETLRYFGAL
ncbi:NAD-dependent epimerase/dehydratase family protein [Rubrobacter indicoceani]|uniref:NAD-dependent epimerase/dehydratase family protein n=1 Tax=Rubrobacter indicoceani TaxID=2051957 RepID=UPI000E5A468F|nr:NAD-dependent epimerase/dehydratase family protein [Rubrobacter indicoceani]